MSAVMEPGEVTKVGTGMQGEAIPSCLTTTLYDVIVAIQDVLSPDDSALVVATVVDRSIGKSNGLFHRLLLEFAHKKYAQSEQHDGETTWVTFRRQQDKIS